MRRGHILIVREKQDGPWGEWLLRRCLEAIARCIGGILLLVLLDRIAASAII